MLITRKTRLNLVIGHPLHHTQSPTLHNTIYELLNIDAVLLATECVDIKSIIQSIKTLGIGLTAVTMPFKEKILPFLDEYRTNIDDLNSVNTIIQYKDKLYGYNTDIDGIAYAFRNVIVEAKQVLIIGAGCAARAAACFFQKKKAHLLWFNRTQENALKMVKIYGGEVINDSYLKNNPVDIIINTTPLGMFPHIQDSPLPNHQFNQNQVIFDMVYNPLDTKLLQQARQYGAFTISGLDMLIGQGIRQIELWSGKGIFTENIVAQLKAKLISQQDWESF